MKVCLSVGWSVGPSVGRMVGWPVTCLFEMPKIEFFMKIIGAVQPLTLRNVLNVLNVLNRNVLNELKMPKDCD